MNCLICLETENLKTCKYCKTPEYVCVKCILTYLDGKELTPHCMCCKHEWDYNYMLNNMTEIITNPHYITQFSNMLYKEINHILINRPDMNNYIEQLKNQLFVLYAINQRKKIKEIGLHLHDSVNKINKEMTQQIAQYTTEHPEEIIKLKKIYKNLKIKKLLDPIEISKEKPEKNCKNNKKREHLQYKGIIDKLDNKSYSETLSEYYEIMKDKPRYLIQLNKKYHFSKNADFDNSIEGMCYNIMNYNESKPSDYHLLSPYREIFSEYIRFINKIYFPFIGNKGETGIIQTIKDKYLKTTQNEINLENEIFGKCTALNCEGIVYKNNYKCNLCKKKVCQHCNTLIELHKTSDEKTTENKTENNSENKTEKIYICDKANLESFKMIKKETVQCPKCLSFIFKISGCDQMFCTNCFTAFDWNTKKIVTSNIHNPHYFDYLKNKSKMIEDNPQNIRCDILNEERLISLIKKFITNDKKIIEILMQKNVFAENIQKLQTYLENSRDTLNMIIINYHISNGNNNNDNIIKQLLGIIPVDITSCKQQLYNKYIEIQNAKELMYIYQMYVQVLTDIFVKLQYKLLEFNQFKQNNKIATKKQINVIYSEIALELSEFAKYTQELSKTNKINNKELFIDINLTNNTISSSTDNTTCKSNNCDTFNLKFLQNNNLLIENVDILEYKYLTF